MKIRLKSSCSGNNSDVFKATILVCLVGDLQSTTGNIIIKDSHKTRVRLKNFGQAARIQIIRNIDNASHKRNRHCESEIDVNVW